MSRAYALTLSLVVLSACFSRSIQSEPFLRGDVNADSRLNLSDGLAILNFNFRGGPAPGCMDAADANDDGKVTGSLGDAIYLFSYFYRRGPRPPEPFPVCGTDPSRDDLDCKDYAPCDGSCGGPREPELLELAPGTSGIGPGDVLTLSGFDFACGVEENIVRFVWANGSLEGRTLSLSFSGDPESPGRRPSELRVIVPNGVRSGSVELESGGQGAGSFEITALPQIVAVGFGTSCSDVALGHGNEIGIVHREFTLQGLNFQGIDELSIQDDQGNRNTVARIGLEIASGEAGKLDVLIVDATETRLGGSGRRFSYRAELLSDGVSSNPTFIPVTQSFSTTTHGAVINQVRIEPGVFDGPTLPIEYSIYDGPVNCRYQLHFEWSIDKGTTWFEAVSANLPDNDGTLDVLPGEFQGNLDGLYCAQGAIRKFIWDRANDLNFLEARKTSLSHSVILRAWASQTDCEAKIDTGFLLQTPPIAIAD